MLLNPTTLARAMALGANIGAAFASVAEHENRGACAGGRYQDCPRQHWMVPDATMCFHIAPDGPDKYFQMAATTCVANFTSFSQIARCFVSEAQTPSPSPFCHSYIGNQL